MAKEKKKAVTTSATRKPRHRPVMYRFIRNHVETELVKNHNFDKDVALSMIASFDDLEIDGVSEDQAVLKNVRFERGSFLRWILEHREEIFKLIMAIVQILLLFADRPTGFVGSIVSAKELDHPNPPEYASAD